jgi:hypothetical protein
MTRTAGHPRWMCLSKAFSSIDVGITGITSDIKSDQSMWIDYTPEHSIACMQLYLGNRQILENKATNHIGIRLYETQRLVHDIGSVNTQNIIILPIFNT